MPRRQTASGVKPPIGCAGESDHATVRRHGAGNHVEQSGLAGAVRADDRENHALRHVEADAVDSDKAAEPLADAIERKQRGHGERSVMPSRRASHGQMPSGSATITSSRQMP